MIKEFLKSVPLLVFCLTFSADLHAGHRKCVQQRNHLKTRLKKCRNTSCRVGIRNRLYRLRCYRAAPAIVHRGPVSPFNCSDNYFTQFNVLVANPAEFGLSAGLQRGFCALMKTRINSQARNGRTWKGIKYFWWNRVAQLKQHYKKIVLDRTGCGGPAPGGCAPNINLFRDCSKSCAQRKQELMAERQKQCPGHKNPAGCRAWFQRTIAGIHCPTFNAQVRRNFNSCMRAGRQNPNYRNDRTIFVQEPSEPMYTAAMLMHEARHVYNYANGQGGHVGCWSANGVGKENCDEIFYPNPMDKNHKAYSQTAYVWYVFAQMASNISYADQNHAKAKLNYTLRTHFNNLRRNSAYRSQFELR